MKKIAYTLTVLLLSIASVAMANSDALNVNPAGAIGAYTPDDQFAGACPKCFSQKKSEDLLAKYNDLLQGNAAAPTAAPAATDAADGGEKQ